MGVVMYIMLSGKVPFPGRSEQEIIKNVIKGEFHFNHAAFKEVGESCKDLIRRCLVKDLDTRYNATNCLEHPWLATVEDSVLSSGTIGGEVQTQVIEDIQSVLQ